MTNKKHQIKATNKGFGNPLMLAISSVRLDNKVTAPNRRGYSQRKVSRHIHPYCQTDTLQLFKDYNY